MNCEAVCLDYSDTGYFSKLVTDYVAGAASLKSFYQHPVSIDGIASAIAGRMKFDTNREVLVNTLQKQYKGIETTDLVRHNIEALLGHDTFTICTAHQPNLFTGHLYFIYKILHTVRLAEELNNQMKGMQFVPVFYMGSEDADLEELGHIFLNGRKIEWNTKQKGAVGRMLVHKELVELIDSMEGEISIQPYGNDIITLLRNSYTMGSTIQDATFKLVNALFAEYGVIVLIPDSAPLKALMHTVFEDDLLNNTGYSLVTQTSGELNKMYKVQAHPREINLFYLKDDIRNRITKEGDIFHVEGTTIQFSQEEMLSELREHPERFSPNVILRGLFQETILPNVVFIGGGGEVAYWLQLRDLFVNYKVPYPVVVLRNSFMVANPEALALAENLALYDKDLFRSAEGLLKQLVERGSKNQLSLKAEKQDLEELYKKIEGVASAIDVSLNAHTKSLAVAAMHKIEVLEKKMLKAEKRKFEAEQRQLHKLRGMLFPNEQLQERVDNFITYYARWGTGFLQTIYVHSAALEQKLCILKINE
jgi:bacillithiol synthase